jgi:predicted  nucleic acid-binding Zn-ribbon protein
MVDEQQQQPDADDGGEESAGGVLTLVCLTCGKEYYFDSVPPSARQKCEKCGGSVFRSFHSPESDEASDDFRETTERDLSTDQPATDTRPGDLMDLDRG